MSGDLYAALLEEISRALGCKTLVPDERNACLIDLPFGLSLRIEPDRRDEYLIIFTPIEELPLGKYREQILYEALKANDDEPPRYGNFAYNPLNNQLVLWDLFFMKTLRGGDVARALIPFLKKALECKHNIQKNVIPVIPRSGEKKSSPMGLFGLR